MRKKFSEVFKDADEYTEFALKHKVFGAEAVALKKKLDKQKEIPLPKIRRGNKK